MLIKKLTQVQQTKYKGTVLFLLH